jgi:zinc/manganese transport system permease protein
VGAHFSPNLIADLTDMWSLPFMVNAFRAATLVAVLGAAVGVVMVIRGQSFIGHSLAVVGLPGASGAVLLGLPAALGYYAAAGIGVLVLRSRYSPTGLRYADENATVGTFQATALATGLLFISLYNGFLGGTSSLLFGSILGVTDGQVVQLAIISATVLLALAVFWRPILFTSLDPVVAASRGLPTSSLSLVFLLLLGITAAAVAQITGALLVFALLVLPAASAQLLTTRPARAVAAAIGFALVTAWSALFAAYYTAYPVGFWLTSIAFGLYVVLRLATLAWSARLRRSMGEQHEIFAL